MAHLNCLDEIYDIELEYWGQYRVPKMIIRVMVSELNRVRRSWESTYMLYGKDQICVGRIDEYMLINDVSANNLRLTYKYLINIINEVQAFSIDQSRKCIYIVDDTKIYIRKQDFDGNITDV